MGSTNLSERGVGVSALMVIVVRTNMLTTQRNINICSSVIHAAFYLVLGFGPYL